MEDERPVIDFAKYITDRTRDFTGREWVFQAINAWLANPDGPQFFLLTGKPGSGKTAIAGRLSQFAKGEPAPAELGCFTRGFLDAVHFCSVQDSLWIDPFVFAGSVATQLANRYPAYRKALEAPSEGQQACLELKEVRQDVHSVSDSGMVIGVVINVSGPSAEYAFNRAVRLPLEALFQDQPVRQIVILVDSLDEALTWREEINIVSLLTESKNLPAGVRFILTCRPESEVLSLLQDYDPQIHTLSAGAGIDHSLNDIERHVLDRLNSQPLLAGKLAAGFSREEFAATVRGKSEGNFLYVRHLLQMLGDQQGEVSKQSLAKFPVGLDRIYLEFLRRLPGKNKVVLKKRQAAVLGTLAVAREALTEQQLANFTRIKKAQVRKVLQPLSQLLDWNESLPPSERAYAIYHRSFSEFLLDEDRAKWFWCEENEEHARIANFYLAGFKNKQQGIDSYGLNHRTTDLRESGDVEHQGHGRAPGRTGVDWSQADDYGLLHLAAHLYALKDEAAYRHELYGLICQPFMSQKQSRYGSHQPFAADVTLTIEMSASEKPPDIVQEIRGSLLYATLSVLAANVEPGVLGVLAHTSQSELNKARGYAALIMKAEMKSEAYLLIGEALLKQKRVKEAWEVLMQALSATEAIENERNKSLKVGRVAQALVRAEEFDRALAAVNAIGDECYKARALRELAQALVLAGHKGKAVTSLSNALALFQKEWLHPNRRNFPEPQTMSPEFARVRLRRLEIGDKLGKAYVLRELAQGLVSSGQKKKGVKVVNQALALLETIKGGDVIESDRVQKTNALSEVAWVLAQAGEKSTAAKLANRALAATKEMGDGEITVKADVLVRVAQVLTQTGNRSDLKRTLAALAAIKQKDIEAYNLAWLAEALAEIEEKTEAAKVAHHALLAAKEIGDEQTKAAALGRVAHALTNVGESERLSEVAAEVETIIDKASLATALSSVSQALAQAGKTDRAAEVANRALATAKQIGIERDRTNALGKVAEALARAGECDKALATVDELGTMSRKALVLGRMAQALAETGEYEKAAEVANKSVATGEAIRNLGARAEAMSSIAQALAFIGKKEKAAEIASRAFAVAKTIEEVTERDAALAMVAQALALAGESDKALASAAGISTNGIEKAYALSETAAALAWAGEKSKAAGMATQAFAATGKQRPLSDYALKEVVQALALADQLDQSLELTKKIREEWMREYAVVEIAQILAQAGHYDKALAAAANVSAGNRAVVLSRTAQALARAGEAEKALELADQDFITGKHTHLEEQAEVLSLVADVLAQAGKPARAVEVADRAVAALGGNIRQWIKAKGLSNVAHALALSGEKDKAANAANQALAAVVAIEKEIPSNRKVDARQRVAEALVMTGQQEQVLWAYGSEFKSARTSGREKVLEMIGNAALLIASIDHGKTLLGLYETVVDVESWWDRSY